MQARIIETEAELALLAEPWRKLSALAGARPFQDFGWLRAWLRTFAAESGYKLRTATLWEDGRLVAALPLVLRRHKGVRVLQWLGEQVTDYCDAIVDPNIDARTALACLWDELTRRGGFDLARLKHVRNDASVRQFLEGLNPWVETSGTAHGIPIDCASGKAWVEQLPPRRRERLTYNLRRMGRMGFEFWIWQPGTPVDPLIDALLEQKRSWLASQGLGGVLLEAPAGPFLRTLAAEMAGQGLHLSAIRSQDKIAACHLGFLRHGVLYSYMPSYDLSLQKYSYGNVLREALIMWACDNCVQRFDLLLGDEEYKTQYESSTQESVRTLVIPHGLLGRAVVSLYRGLAAREPRRPIEKKKEAGDVAVADSAVE